MTRKSSQLFFRPDADRWIVRYYDQDGVRREKWHKTKKDAQASLRDLKRTEREAAERKKLARMPIELEELITEFIESSTIGRDGALPLSRDTIRSYRAHLQKTARFFPKKAVKDITIGDMRRFQLYLLERCTSRITAQRVLAITKTMLKFAVQHEYIERNPAEHSSIRLITGREDPKKRVKVFSEAEVTELLGVARSLRDSCVPSIANRWYSFYPLTLTLALLGVRISEALALRYSDFHEDYLMVEIQRRLEGPKRGLSIEDRLRRPKSRNGVRTIPVPDVLAEVLRDMARRTNDKDSFVFASSTGIPHNYANVVNRMWKPLLREADVRYRGMHCLRHTYASILMKHGKYNDVSKLLGHSTSSFTMDHYGHMMTNNREYMKEIAEFVVKDMVI